MVASITIAWRSRVFSDPVSSSKTWRLRSIRWSRRLSRTFDQSPRSGQVVVLEAPLLVEAGFAPDFDLVVTVETSPKGADPAGGGSRV